MVIEPDYPAFPQQVKALWVSITRPLITVIKHGLHQPEAPVIMELCTKRLPAHWKTTQCWKAHTAVSTGGVSVKDTNESKGTRGRGRGGERSTPLPPGLSGDGRGLLLNQINRSRDLLK